LKNNGIFQDRQSGKKETIMSTLLSERRQPITAPKLGDRVPAQRSTPAISARQEPAAAVPCDPVVAPRASLSLILGSIVATLRKWRRRRRERGELASLDDRTLRDIGLDPGAVDYEVRQAFWRPSRDWRD
jgi:uncharacterized protein YjiS (DUF1127 family)